MNVYPLEVELALGGVTGVEELAVFGVQDERWGQRVCVAVIANAVVDRADIERAAEERLAPYKRPKDTYFVDDLPRTSTGKIRRSAIAAHLGLE